MPAALGSSLRSGVTRGSEFSDLRVFIAGNRKQYCPKAMPEGSGCAFNPGRNAV